MKNHIKSYAKRLIPKIYRERLNKIKPFVMSAYRDLRFKKLRKIVPPKPTVVNLLVNDTCNSRCQMCLIWKNKKSKEISPSELSIVLLDPLFSDIKYIGVSGGEPTLRSDLSEIFEVICTKKPKILGAGLITNGIIENSVRQKVLDCAEVCNSYDVDFNLMISLDGISEIHDVVRGRKGNFNTATSLLDFFHNETGINTSFGCTISASNALYVDELLDYAISKGIYGRFRVAEFIDRLYNAEQSQFIRAFDDVTSYHLGLFFFRLEHAFETDEIYKKTYRNIRKMLTEGKPRQIGCPYQSNAVVLASSGDLLYCSPKSPVLGNSLNESASNIYFQNLRTREAIIENDCSSCIHDYHESLTINELLNEKIFSRIRKNKYKCDLLISKSIKYSKIESLSYDFSNLNSQKVLILGWYGTETVGDKAILSTIVRNLRTRSIPPKTIYLSSLFPFISQWTIKEMELGEITIVETYTQNFDSVCAEVDEMVVGGGPLMDIEPLNHILYAFIQSAKYNSIARIEGCGLGPLSQPIYMQVVSEIFRLSNHITLRDRASTERCLNDFSIAPSDTVADPATYYVLEQREKLIQSMPPQGMGSTISCFLREWGKEYSLGLEQQEYELAKNKFEFQLAHLIAFVAQAKNLDVHLLPMHVFHVGGDDRVFNRSLARSIQSKLSRSSGLNNVSFAREPVSPFVILHNMFHSQLNICMRFHSVVFAENLDVPYFAIDYTSGGKIEAYLRDVGKLNRLISVHDIANGNWKEKMEILLSTG
ncbi:Sporulation killing factor maturation protein SkfB [Acaryochloris thomasi RCC1774]|uniref:Sporulation killing factor maturation protein SkfB n=1 Tax=Acaryochloris thomasi RCC1774 TaxID=1764569 RepID=A0A2W1JQF6_9CYAN|nr:polysaccharide pyruvyl transferase family protein [Acaryochloris thomasi]PZD72364.1 Sporulation killing factor maturation protein SkfB [Acaryochloris thomasi RCC1774]